MATTTQYNPNTDMNHRLLEAGVSKTVYALVSPEVEEAKLNALKGEQYIRQFRGAWTGKQDRLHEEFFDLWHEWAAPVVDLDRSIFPFHYPTAGASEGLRHLIYDFAARCSRSMMPPLIHIFEGEYEGYKAMAEGAGVEVQVWHRSAWRALAERLNYGPMGWSHMVFLSQPSAIDGNVWHDCNEFLAAITMPNCVVIDITYVGAVPEDAIKDRFALNVPSVRNVVFSLSKPFGVYYDRIGGVFSREEDLGLFGNRWFKNLTSIRLGTHLLKSFGVFDLPEHYRDLQADLCKKAERALPGLALDPADVYILATGSGEGPLADYLKRDGKVRVCLTPAMAQEIGTDA